MALHTTSQLHTSVELICLLKAILYVTHALSDAHVEVGGCSAWLCTLVFTSACTYLLRLLYPPLLQSITCVFIRAQSYLCPCLLFELLLTTFTWYIDSTYQKYALAARCASSKHHGIPCYMLACTPKTCIHGMKNVLAYPRHLVLSLNLLLSLFSLLLLLVVVP